MLEDCYGAVKAQRAMDKGMSSPNRGVKFGSRGADVAVAPKLGRGVGNWAPLWAETFKRPGAVPDRRTSPVLHPLLAAGRAKSVGPCPFSGNDHMFDFDALDDVEPLPELEFDDWRPASPAKASSDVAFDFDALDEVSGLLPVILPSSLSVPTLDLRSASVFVGRAMDRRFSGSVTSVQHGGDSELAQKLAKRRSAVEDGGFWLYENLPASPARAGARVRSVNAEFEPVALRPHNANPLQTSRSLPSSRSFPAVGSPRGELTRTLSGRLTHVDRYGEVVQSAGCRPSREVDARSSLADESAEIREHWLERHGIGGAMAYYAEKRTATFDFTELDLEESRVLPALA